MWSIQGRVAEQGMIFGLSALNRVFNFTRVCPKPSTATTSSTSIYDDHGQDLNLRLLWFFQIKGCNHLHVKQGGTVLSTDSKSFPSKRWPILWKVRLRYVLPFL